MYASIYIFKLLNARLKSIAAKPGRNQSRVNRAHERLSSSRPSRTQNSIPREMSEYSSYFYERRCYICERSASYPKNRYVPKKSTHRVRFTEPSKWNKFLKIEWGHVPRINFSLFLFPPHISFVSRLVSIYSCHIFNE